MAKIYNYYPGANTSLGFYSFYNYLPVKADKIYIIKGGPGCGKSTFMKKIGKRAEDKGYSLELHWCSSDNDSLDGIVIKELKTAILDGTAPHTVDPVFPGVKENILDFGQFWNNTILINNKNSIITLTNKIKAKFQDSYFHLREAGHFHNKFCKENNKIINRNSLNKIINKYIDKINLNIAKNSNIKTYDRHLFMSAITPHGPKNFFTENAANLDFIFTLKGIPGIGKSYFLKHFAQKVKEKNYTVLYFHCSLNPEKYDAIIIPELKVGLFDDNIPHKIKSKNIKIEENINLNDYIISKKRDNYNELYFNLFIDEAVKNLKKAKSLHDRLEDYYIEAMNFSQLNQLSKSISRQIFNI
ncbi:MAG: hypothetical protein ACOCQ2_02745 [Halanaerobiales bacterium]